MTLNEFWNLMQLARVSVEKTTDLPDWVHAHLAKQSVEYIGGFHRQFREASRLSYDARLWGAATLMMKFCSDDKFTDFRAWLISKGQRVFESAVNDPDTLAEVEVDGDYGRPILFKLTYVAEAAYREKVGRFADIADLVPNLSHIILLNPSAWDGDQKSLPLMLPRLSVKFGS